MLARLVNDVDEAAATAAAEHGGPRSSFHDEENRSEDLKMSDDHQNEPHFLSAIRRARRSNNDDHDHDEDQQKVMPPAALLAENEEQEHDDSCPHILVDDPFIDKNYEDDEEDDTDIERISCLLEEDRGDDEEEGDYDHHDDDSEDDHDREDDCPPPFSFVVQAHCDGDEIDEEIVEERGDVPGGVVAAAAAFTKSENRLPFVPLVPSQESANHNDPSSGGGEDRDDERWELWFQALLKYKTLHGHCNVPRSYEMPHDFISLDGLKKSSSSEADKVTTSTDKHNLMSAPLRLAVAVKTSKHVDSFGGAGVGRWLGRWLQCQRQKKRLCSLREDRQRRLQELVSGGCLDWYDTVDGRKARKLRRTSSTSGVILTPKKKRNKKEEGSPVSSKQRRKNSTFDSFPVATADTHHRSSCDTVTTAFVSGAEEESSHASLKIASKKRVLEDDLSTVGGKNDHKQQKSIAKNASPDGCGSMLFAATTSTMSMANDEYTSSRGSTAPPQPLFKEESRPSPAVRSVSEGYDCQTAAPHTNHGGGAAAAPPKTKEPLSYRRIGNKDTLHPPLSTVPFPAAMQPPRPSPSSPLLHMRMGNMQQHPPPLPPPSPQQIMAIMMMQQWQLFAQQQAAAAYYSYMMAPPPPPPPCSGGGPPRYFPVPPPPPPQQLREAAPTTGTNTDDISGGDTTNASSSCFPGFYYNDEEESMMIPSLDSSLVQSNSQQQEVMRSAAVLTNSGRGGGGANTPILSARTSSKSTWGVPPETIVGGGRAPSSKYYRSSEENRPFAGHSPYYTPFIAGGLSAAPPPPPPPSSASPVVSFLHQLPPPPSAAGIVSPSSFVVVGHYLPPPSTSHHVPDHRPLAGSTAFCHTHDDDHQQRDTSNNRIIHSLHASSSTTAGTPLPPLSPHDRSHLAPSCSWFNKEVVDAGALASGKEDAAIEGQKKKNSSQGGGLIGAAPSATPRITMPPRCESLCSSSFASDEEVDLVGSGSGGTTSRPRSSSVLSRASEVRRQEENEVEERDCDVSKRIMPEDLLSSDYGLFCPIDDSLSSWKQENKKMIIVPETSVACDAHHRSSSPVTAVPLLPAKLRKRSFSCSSDGSSYDVMAAELQQEQDHHSSSPSARARALADAAFSDSSMAGAAAAIDCDYDHSNKAKSSSLITSFLRPTSTTSSSADSFFDEDRDHKKEMLGYYPFLRPTAPPRKDCRDDGKTHDDDSQQQPKKKIDAHYAHGNRCANNAVSVCSSKSPHCYSSSSSLPALFSAPASSAPWDNLKMLSAIAASTTTSPPPLSPHPKRKWLPGNTDEPL